MYSIIGVLEYKRSTTSSQILNDSMAYGIKIEDFDGDLIEAKKRIRFGYKAPEWMIVAVVDACGETYQGPVHFMTRSNDCAKCCEHMVVNNIKVPGSAACEQCMREVYA
jgi:hypothetical protein